MTIPYLKMDKMMSPASSIQGKHTIILTMLKTFTLTKKRSG